MGETSSAKQSWARKGKLKGKIKVYTASEKHGTGYGGIHYSKLPRCALFFYVLIGAPQKFYIQVLALPWALVIDRSCSLFQPALPCHLLYQYHQTSKQTNKKLPGSIFFLLRPTAVFRYVPFLPSDCP